ncbi:hypothetical protein [Algoriphagus taiwanensis]|uniref:Outer membrane protein beta-barrel domain-containing protein n=1 Tax=Algoriphagus taiwanensis TaxID=1445656 RepID=A0ABQ6Q364_9BACT|nr:hypothetical protein Ataiwa_28390 [Algoriphagus taiwanensis]
MQEDNLDKWLAKNLRRHQDNDPVPYEEGAWEAFQAKRVGVGFKFAYWAGGMAASLLIFLAAYFALDMGKIGELNPTGQENLAEQSLNEPVQENPLKEEINSLAEDNSPSPETQEVKPQETSPQLALNSDPGKPKANFDHKKNGQPLLLAEKEDAAGKETKATPSEMESKEERRSSTPIAEAKMSAEDSLTQSKVEALKKQIAELTEAEEKQPTSADEYRTRTLSLGFSPGVSSSQADNQSISGTSLGLGAQVNWALGEKLELGSGMGVNFFNQSDQGESFVQIANASYPVRQEVDVSQVQIDIPLFVTYPVNRRQSIAIQAGFSNLMAFTNKAQQENSYLRQVAVFDAQSANSDGFTLRSESVSSLSTVDTPSSRFIPFATANLGVNIVVLESKKAAYLLMPFYNYPLQDISGTGNNPGFFGAALKVNFGTVQKK